MLRRAIVATVVAWAISIGATWLLVVALGEGVR